VAFPRERLKAGLLGAAFFALVCAGAFTAWRALFDHSLEQVAESAKTDPRSAYVVARDICENGRPDTANLEKSFVSPPPLTPEGRSSTNQAIATVQRFLSLASEAGTEEQAASLLSNSLKKEVSSAFGGHPFTLLALEKPASFRLTVRQPTNPQSVGVIGKTTDEGEDKYIIFLLQEEGGMFRITDVDPAFCSDEVYALKAKQLGLATPQPPR